MPSWAKNAISVNNELLQAMKLFAENFLRVSCFGDQNLRSREANEMAS